MNKLLLIGLLLMAPGFSKNKSMATSTVAPAGKKFTITHFNMMFAPDLSNRVNPALYKRPLNDVIILDMLTNNLWPSILRHNRSENQKDKVLVDFINKGLISEYNVDTEKYLIDFGRFANQNERINYIMARPGAKQTLGKEIQSMHDEFARINRLASKKNFGADIWTYFSEGIDEKRIFKPEAPINDGHNTYYNVYRNILILTTDGYIEAGIYDKGFDLSRNTIDKFRKAFLASGEADLRRFFKKNPQFHIKPVRNENLKNLEILVMELYDRSRSTGGAATVQPTDMEIIKLFWSDWLEQSKVKRFELHPYANSKPEAEKIILDFLGVTKKA